MSLVRLSIYTLFALVALICSYQAYRVYAAVQETDSVRARYLDTALSPISLQQIPPAWIDMMLQIEDPGFYLHNGVDFSTPGAGMTTITQGIAKFMYFTDFKPGFKKIEQSLIARYVIDQRFSKTEQLTVFYNHVYLGNDKNRKIRGFAQAADFYFATDFSNLTEQQYLALVAMLVAPNRFNVKRQPEQNASRVRKIRAVLNGSYTPKSLTDVHYDGI